VRRPGYLLFVAALAVAFGAWYWHWTGRPKTLETEAGNHVLVGERTGEGMDARAVGELALAGSCIGIQVGDAVEVVVWPHGTEATREGLLLPDGTVVTLGEEVEASGGAVEDDPNNPRVPEDCPQGTYFLTHDVSAAD
jgi:hypothetical protein